MVTKCVKACLVSGAIASTLIPGSPLVTSGGGTSMRKQNNREVSPDISQLLTEEVATEKADVKTRRRPTSRRALGHFRMTAYTEYRQSSGRTASGTRPSHERTVAVDPRVIPLGTKIEIEGVGVRIAEDTGRLIKGRKLDVFLPSVQACTRFGVRSRKVYIID